MPLEISARARGQRTRKIGCDARMRLSHRKYEPKLVEEVEQFGERTRVCLDRY